MVLDINLKVIYANKSFCQTFEVSAEETIGEYIFDLGNKQWNIPKLKKLLNTILPKNTSFENFEVEHRFEDIGQKTMLLNARRIPRPPLKPKIILLAIEDITKRKKKEEEILEASELRYRRLFESAQDGILLLDYYTGMIVDVNQLLIDLLGYTKNDLLKKHIWDIGVFKNIAASKSNFKTLQAKNYIHYENLPLETKSGKVIAAEFIANSYQVDGDKTIQCNIRDITDRRQMEKSLKASEEKYSTLVEKGNDGVLIIQNKGILKYVNSAICEMTGYTKKETIGKPFVGYISPEYKELAADRYKKRLMGIAAPSRYDIEIISKEGEKTPVEINSSRIEYEGKPAIMAIVRDITERKEVEKTKDDFLSIASHALRTPMTAIKGFLDMVIKGQAGKIPTTKMKEYLKLAYAGNQRMIQLVNDLLNVSRFEAGRMKFDLTDTHIEKIIENETNNKWIWSGDEQLVSRDYMVSYRSLADAGGVNVASIMVAQSLQSIVEQIAYSMSMAYLISIVLMLISILPLVFIARAITRSVEA